MLRTARFAVLSVAIGAIMATMTPPASATTYKAITLTGQIVMSSGFGYPCTPLGTTECIDNTATATAKTGPKNEPQVNLTPGGNTAGFGLGSALCVKTSISTPNKPTVKTGPADLCVLTATGVITGFCELATGAGVATLVNLTNYYKTTISTSFKFTEVGGTYHFTGGNKETNFYAEVNVVPDVTLGGPSCTNKTAIGFTVTGQAVYKDCTKGTTAGVCNL